MLGVGAGVREGDTSLLGSLLPNLLSTEEMLTNRIHPNPTCNSPALSAGKSGKS